MKKNFLTPLLAFALVFAACGNASNSKKEEKMNPDTVAPVAKPAPADTTPPPPADTKKQEPAVPKPTISKGNIPVPVPGLPADTGRIEKDQSRKPKQ